MSNIAPVENGLPPARTLYELTPRASSVCRQHTICPVLAPAADHLERRDDAAGEIVDHSGELLWRALAHQEVDAEGRGRVAFGDGRLRAPEEFDGIGVAVPLLADLETGALESA